MFDPVDPRQSFPDLERGILRYWKEEDTFKRSIRARSKMQGDLLDGATGATETPFSFYDGPPFATGLPHYGHLLAGTIKDVIPRYQTMQGKRVERRFGWDCHGLPIENIIEKEHGITDKKQIEEMGVKAFNDLCRGTVQRYTGEWRTVVERIGRWVDMDWDYRTMDPEYMESIWWVFASLAEKGLIYEGYKPMHVCPRCVTPLSNFEVTQGYKDVIDQSAYVQFELVDEPGTFMLAWTTTPWTLPGNLFLAVNPQTVYASVTCEGKTYIVAQERADDVFKGKEFAVEGKGVSGKSLVGKHYRPLFPYYAEKYAAGFRVVAGDFVTTEDGTGIVHIAPGFGEDDYGVWLTESKKKEFKDLPLLQPVGMDGHYDAAVTDFAGLHVKPKDNPSETDLKVQKYLKEKGLLFRTESFKHPYPHCWRCDSPLLNYATSSWFVAVEKIKEKMLQSNAATEWVPENLRDGRFGKWLEGARDWAISRSRYWGTPLPIWRSKGSPLDVIGSRQDLMDRKAHRFTRVTVVRHGESEGNLIPIYQGEVPGTDLTKAGQEQAKRAGAMLANEKVSAVYASPLARTQQTAQGIADATDNQVRVDERLREVAFGEYEKKTVDFTDLTFVKARRAHKLEHNKVESIYHFPGMETWSQVQARIASFLRETLPRHRGEHIVIVTHADPLQSVKHFFTQEDPAKLCNQPYPTYADPHTFFWDHETESAMDLHKETVDDIRWPGPPSALSVDATFVRHGETDWNKAGKVQGGEVDEPLNDTGRAQALALAQTLKASDYDCVVTSDLERARETGKIIAEHLGIPVAGQTDLLRERRVGNWEAQSMDQIMNENPFPFPDSRTVSLHFVTPTGGESLTQFLRRLEKAYDFLLENYAGKRVLVVGHAGTVRGFRLITGQATYRESITDVIGNTASVHAPLHPWMRRIPEVLDCWFESGSMPYAQSHFPFEHRIRNGKTDALPPGFPADFIAEGIDQTRGWFYTLTVLGSALYGVSPFKNVIVNGTVLAEDGKKMSKRLKNYPEPLEVVEKHGADAVRFALMSSPAVRGEDLRFSGKLVEETLRGVLLPLWNTYAFFVTYANAAKWEPQESRRHSAHPLDRWIRAEMQDLVNRMTSQLDAYDLSATCAELADTIDGLTNWYVRLSRRRFAGKSGMHAEALSGGHEEEKGDALHTLHDVLLTLCQLLAPFCPFITDAIYLNLVAEEHGSIHLTDWPETRTLTAPEQSLLTRTRLLRTVVSLGLKIRSEQKIKVRQPLAKATVAVPESLLNGAEITPAEMRLLQEEINVKSVEFVADAGTIAEAFVQVDARKVGPRLGGRVQEIIKAGKSGQFTVEKDGSILILDERLSSDEAALVYRGKEGQNVAADRGAVIALDTRLTPELELEGKARDLVRAIQQLRKDGGLEMQDKIMLQVENAAETLAAHGTLVESETNASLGPVDGDGYEVDLDGTSVTIRFRKV